LAESRSPQSKQKLDLIGVNRSGKPPPGLPPLYKKEQ
jgi:hypothetical protein